jgi:alpha-L-fucosidase
MLRLRLLLFAAWCSFGLNAQAPSTTANAFTPDWASLDARPTPEWWKDAKFGIFIHWGVYSVPGYSPKGRYAEWYQKHMASDDPDSSINKFHRAMYGNRTYYDLADDFKAPLFNADEWAQLFENAGAKYVVLTAKHHDGFCLWPSAEANKGWGFPWNSVERGSKRDLVGELTGALRKTSVKPGLYYSLYEWFHPLWQFDKARYAAEHAQPQMRDLVTRYQPDVFWTDGEWDATPEVWQSQQFLSWLYSESPVKDNVVTNDRWGIGTRFTHGGVFTPEYQPELGFDNHDWEESRGMGYSYGYNRDEDAWDYNSSQQMILQMVDKVARGGNFLLDIGPDAYGQIPPIMQQRLLDIGNWMAVNGEAIYGTRAWRSHCQWSAGKRDYTGPDMLNKQTLEPDPGFAVKEAFFTFSPRTRSLYAILPQYPRDRKFVLREMTLPGGTEVVLLDSKERLKWENTGGNVVISLPEYHPSKFKAPESFAIRINNFGMFVARPVLEVKYDPTTMQPLVTMMAAPGTTIRYTTDGSMPTLSSSAYEQPLRPDRTSTLKAKAFRPGLLESAVTEQQVTRYSPLPALTFIQPPKPGLLAHLRTTEDRYTSANIEKGKTVAAGIVDNFSLDPMCAKQCGMVWQGYIQVEENGGYQFWTNSDDASMLYIDNQMVVNNDGDHNLTEKTGSVFLQRGWHSIKVVYVNSGGEAGLSVQYAPYGQAKRDLPSGALAH